MWTFKSNWWVKISLLFAVGHDFYNIWWLLKESFVWVGVDSVACTSPPMLNHSWEHFVEVTEYSLHFSGVTVSQNQWISWISSLFMGFTMTHRKCFNLFQKFSMGLRSGLFAGLGQYIIPLSLTTSIARLPTIKGKVLDNYELSALVESEWQA